MPIPPALQSTRSRTESTRTEPTAPIPPRQPTPGRPGAGALLLDLVAPVALFYGMRAAGVSAVVALAISSLPPALGAARAAVRRRRVDGVAVFVLATMLLSLLATLLTGSPRALLVRGAWLSAPYGLFTLATLLASRPHPFVITRALLPRRAAVMDELWTASPAFRRVWQHITMVWGVATLADAAVRVVMAYTLPVDVVPALDTVLSVATVIVLQVPTHFLLHRSGYWGQLFGPRRGR